MKIKTEIKKFINKLRYYKNLIKTLHNKISQLNVDELKNKSGLNPYQACFSWLLETLVYGLLITIVINSLLGWQGYSNFGYVFLGILRWMIIDFVNDIRRSN